MISAFKKKGFTLMEMLIATLLFFLIVTVVLQIYFRLIKIKTDVDARQILTQNMYYIVERVNVLLKDYAIDYEEYFNRQLVWCNNVVFGWDVGTGGNCQRFTSYGNYNALDPFNASGFKLYYCSSLSQNITSEPFVFSGQSVLSGGGCFDGLNGFQSFGQYRKQFWDVWDDVDTIPWAVGDDDDRDLGDGPIAILDATGVQELYLISQDATRRVYLRRTLIESWDWNNDGVISGDNEYRYTLQILKIRGFDAGVNHDFASSGLYDGVIDTWACDFGEWFVCGWDQIGSVYSWYRLPQDQNDGWVSVFGKDVTINKRNLVIYPSKNPEYSWNNNATQINPYITLFLSAKLYGQVWTKRLGPTISNYGLNIQTTLNTRTNY